MRRVADVLRDLPLRARLIAGAAVLVAAGLLAPLVGDGQAPQDTRRAEVAAGSKGAGLVLGRPGAHGARLLRDKDGRPIRGPDGRPLLVASDGRTILDSSGRPLRGKDGRVLKLGPDGELPRELVGKRRRRKPANDRSALTAGVVYVRPREVNSLLRSNDVSLELPDQAAAARAVAAHINATGGVGGRRLNLRVREAPLLDGRPIPVHHRESCAFFTEQGPKPIAVVGQSGFYWHALDDCLAAREVALLTFHPAEAATPRLRRGAGRRFAPGSLAIDRFPGAYVRALRSTGFFGGKGRVGLVRLGRDSDLDHAADGLKTALAGIGERLAAEVVVPPVNSAADLPRFLLGWTTGAIRLNASGVKRVLVIDSGGFISFFMRAAEAQGYRPRYAVNTTSQPLVLENVAPKRQLRGAVGIGWSPPADVRHPNGDAGAATRSLCRQIFRAAGVSAGREGTGEAVAAYGICSDLLALRAALERSGQASPAGLRAGFERLGSAFSSAMALRTRIDSAHPDGAGAYRVLRFQDGCDCFAYEGPLQGIN